jgi:hypothetical protein
VNGDAGADLSGGVDDFEALAANDAVVARRGGGTLVRDNIAEHPEIHDGKREKEWLELEFHGAASVACCHCGARAVR